MRMLMNVRIPPQPFNAAVKNGSVGAKLNKILETIKPEAVYFTEQNGQRGAVLIVDLPDTSKIPVLAEPWFLTFQADVEFRIAMTPDDLKRSGIDGMGQKWS
ncbi:MAG: panthothenate synthetase [Verrucomicrobiia bacterium]